MLWTAFVIGLFGSLHCAGMCGPIAVSIPGGSAGMVRGSLLYNGGRTITYTFLGLMIGLLGKAAFLAGVQAWLSVATGVFLLVVVIFSINIQQQLLNLGWMQRAYERLKAQLSVTLRQSGWRSHLGVGLLNGLLPCGLVYMAIAGAITAGGIIDSILYMACFGLGTIPLMLTLMLAGQRIGHRFRTSLRRFYPILLLIMASILILRGLRIDLPADITLWTDLPMCH